MLNGSGTVGLGQKAADYLTAQGFNVVRIAAAERSDYRSSLVQVLSDDNDGAAQALATMLKMPQTAISAMPHAERRRRHPHRGRPGLPARWAVSSWQFAVSS